MTDGTRELAIRTDERLNAIEKEHDRSARSQGERIGALEAEVKALKAAQQEERGEGREFRAQAKLIAWLGGAAVGAAVTAAVKSFF